MRILIVDDDECVLTLLREVLTSTGYHEVTSASSAKEALETLSEPDLTFDLFLLDIQMPEVDGVALTKMIRGTPGYDLTPIVMLTAMHDRSYINRAFKAGATDYITKPFDYLDLRKRLQSAQTLAFQNALSKADSQSASEYGIEGRKQRDSAENPVALGPTKDLLGYGEFENYLLQLARRKSGNAWVHSLKIANLERLASNADPDAFIRALRDATRLIHDYFSKFGGIGSYRGKGTFLFVTTKRVGLPREGLEFELNALVEETFAQIGTVPAVLVVGEQAALDMRSDDTVLSTLRRAIDNVEKRHVPEEAMRTVAKQMLRGPRFSDEQRRLEQRTYKSILQTFFTDESQDDWSWQIRQKRPG